MSQITKYAIADSLKRQLQQKPLSKITISDLTEDCGINRMTFYYHFQDIFDLIDWICQVEGERAIGNNRNASTWQEGFLHLCQSVLENKTFIENVYHSIKREQIENFLYNVTHALLMDVIEEQKNTALREKDKEFIVNFYQYAFVGTALSWVKSGMKETPEELTESISKLMNGQFHLAAQNFSTSF